MSDSTTWTQWVKTTEASPTYAAEQAKLDFAVALERRMQQLEVHRAELARRLGTSGAAVTMALRGDANLTLDRMARMAHALDAVVHVHVAPKAAAVKWFERYDNAKAERDAHATTWARLSSGAQRGNSTTIAA